MNRNKYYMGTEEKVLPEIISSGSIIHKASIKLETEEDNELFYYLMPKYGATNLHQFASKNGFDFDHLTIF